MARGANSGGSVSINSRSTNSAAVREQDSSSLDLMDERERYMESECGDYAAALRRLFPHLRFGVQYISGEPFHVFVHDQARAYDYDGAHPLPYELDHPEASTDLDLDEDPAFGSIEICVEDAVEVAERRLAEGEATPPLASGE